MWKCNNVIKVNKKSGIEGRTSLSKFNFAMTKVIRAVMCERSSFQSCDRIDESQNALIQSAYSMHMRNLAS